MSYYFIANIKIKDESEYQKYLDKADGVFKKYNGKYLSVDDSPIILEGRWNFTRTVPIEFPTKKDFNDWYNSEQYQKILKHRLDSADCDTILIKGK